MMKKFFTLIVALVATMSAFAQTSYTSTQKVTVAKDYGPYSTENVVYKVTKYTESNTEYVDIEMPTTLVVIKMAGKYNIGNLTMGGYTVQKLTWDDKKQAYYKDYSNDNLKMYVKTESGLIALDGNYALSGNISMQYNGSSIYVSNNPKPGKMPFDLLVEFGEKPTTINNVEADVNVEANKTQRKYIKNGQLVIVKDGMEFSTAGQRIK